MTTPEERAERIYRAIKETDFEHVYSIGQIEQELRQAEDDILERAAKVADECYLNAYHHEGYADDGTELIEESSLQIAVEEIADKIRALKTAALDGKAGAQ